MKPYELKEGALIRHPGRPEWGPGKIVRVTRDYVVVRFRDVQPPPGKEGQLFRRAEHPLIAADYDVDFVIAAIRKSSAGSGPTPDQAVTRFLQKFPAGFSDEAFERLENSYKRDAQRLFQATLGSREARRLLNAGDAAELARRAERVLSHREPGHKHSPLPHRQEIIAFAAGLTDHAAALLFFLALFDLLDTPGVSPERFGELITAVDRLPQRGATPIVTWPILTVLPFFADPSRFMFLKPSVTNRAANSYRFELNYSSQLNWLTYKQLLTFSRMLFERLREAGARDLMDVQSFIWVAWSDSYRLS